jgi:hypothetical protein
MALRGVIALRVGDCTGDASGAAVVTGGGGGPGGGRGRCFTDGVSESVPSDVSTTSGGGAEAT